jgi:hypothetical protein
MTGWHQRDDVPPEMRGGREAVKEYDRLPFTAYASRVVVESRSVQVEKFAAHFSAGVVFAGGTRVRRPDA